MRHGGHPQEDIHGRPYEPPAFARRQAHARPHPPGPSLAAARRALPTLETTDEYPFFRSLGIGKPALDAAAECAARNATTLERELIANGDLDPRSYYEMLSRILGIRHFETIPPESVVPGRHIDCALRQPRLLAIETDGRRYHVIVPEARTLGHIASWMRHSPSLCAQLAVAAPAAIREAVWSCRAPERAKETVRKLFESDTADSARIVMTGSQGFVLGLFCAALVVCTILSPRVAADISHLAFSVFFLACITLRFAALAFHRRPPVIRATERTKASGLPIYTVVVALYKEAAVVDQLIAALSRLEWPRSLIEIKLICEEDDRETLAALGRHALPDEYEIVRVPPMAPRTKPKALNYALNGARGEFLVIYDAEDRPHPQQLLEAYDTFARSDGRLACLQAPLVVSNAHNSLLSAVFALEYAGLFRGLLPFLARLGLPLPLGGTSNHFRMDALRAAGAWDPFNVTEDADLGMRLYRRGYRGGVLGLPTLEAAPERLDVWMRQRTRWFKGWLQTWLVMMRAPRRLWREMGAAGFIAFQVLIAGMLCSALGHPLLIVFVALAAAKVAAGHLAFSSPFQTALFALDGWNFVGGYLAFILLARRAMISEERRRVGRRWLWVPAYWVAMSAAAWLAVVELVRKPFYWAKTPHEALTARLPHTGAARTTRAPF